MSVDLCQNPSSGWAYAYRLALDETNYENLFVFDCCSFPVV